MPSLIPVRAERSRRTSFEFAQDERRSDGAVLLFAVDGPDVAEAFARADPYVVNDLVTNWRVRRWQTVVGAGAAEPLPPP